MKPPRIPDTVRTLHRRFRQWGMLGLLCEHVEVVIRGRTTQIPAALRPEIERLKALSDGLHYRELARILLVKVGYALDDKRVKKLWQQSPVSCQGHLGLCDYHTQPERYHARLVDAPGLPGSLCRQTFQASGATLLSRAAVAPL